MKYISAWAAYTGSIWKHVQDALAAGECDPNDTVWHGPDGSWVIASDPSELEDTEYLEYWDAGQVSDYLD